MQNTYLKWAKIVALFLLITASILLYINPKTENNLPSGFKTPIIALEFIQDKQEIKAFFQVENVAKYKADLLLGNSIDYLFMVVYSTFLACISLSFKHQLTKTKTVLLLTLCVGMLLGDAIENYQLYQLITKFDGQSELFNAITSYNYYDIHITWLKLFTWIKWFSIALVFLILAPHFLSLKNNIAKATGLIGICSFLLSIAAFLFHGIMNELFAMTVSIEFVLMIVFCLIYKPTITKSS